MLEIARRRAAGQDEARGRTGVTEGVEQREHGAEGVGQNRRPREAEGRAYALDVVHVVREGEWIVDLGDARAPAAPLVIGDDVMMLGQRPEAGAQDPWVGKEVGRVHSGAAVQAENGSSPPAPRLAHEDREAAEIDLAGRDVGGGHGPSSYIAAGMDVTLRWEGDLRFLATGRSEAGTVFDGDGSTAMSPMENLLAALAACMGADVVDILRKGRQQLTGLTIRASGTRREQHPRRLMSATLAIEVEGRGLDPAKAQRAVELSRTTYCSVWSSLAPDIELDLTVAVREASS